MILQVRGSGTKSGIVPMARPGEGGAFIDDTQCVVDPPERPRRDARAGGPAAMDGRWQGPRPKPRLRFASGRRHFDAPRLQLRLLRNRHLEHAVRVPRADRVEVGAFREGEASQEFAAAALETPVGARLFLSARVPLAADGQHAFVGSDLDVLRLDAGDVDQHGEAPGLLVDVDLRNPPGTGGIGGVGGESHIELPLQAVDERPGLIAQNGHVANLQS